MEGPYDDILDREPPKPEGRAPLSAKQRAAQFSPFAALSGFAAVLRETARQTQPEAELDEQAQERLNARLRLLRDRIQDAPAITITYYRPDPYKQGGSYETVCDLVRRVDEAQRFLELASREQIPFERLLDLDCPSFFPE